MLKDHGERAWATLGAEPGPGGECEGPGGRGRRTDGHALSSDAGTDSAAVLRALGRSFAAKCSDAPQEGSKSTREGSSDYAVSVEGLAHEWVLEDLDGAASICHADPADLFEDVLALIAHEEAVLLQPQHADCTRQLLDWLLEDIGSIARSFDFDPLDVFEDALRVIVSDTPLADRLLRAGGAASADFP